MIPVVMAALMVFVAVGAWLEKRPRNRGREVELTITTVAVLLNLPVVAAWFRVRTRPDGWTCLGYSRSFWSVLLWLSYGLGIGFGFWLLAVGP